MITANLISKKRDGEPLNRDELNTFFNGYLTGDVTDAQMSAMLMAIYFNGMNEAETFTMVEVMLDSGSRMDFSDSEQYVADKHSTGGVGDKVSIILAPVLAAVGIKIPMIAGRGLGYTGGTIDKLESIPGFNTSPNLEQFKKWVNQSGYAIIAQSKNICTADKKIYSLRSKTGTIPSTPLICSSIMSKKIAEGISGLVLDIKVGNGTFMKTKENGQNLGDWLKKIGSAFNIKTDVVYSNMNQPLGRYAGLSCEIQESIDCLKGKGPSDLIKITLELGSHLLIQSKLAKDKRTAYKILEEIIDNGKALKTFISSVEMQGGILNNFELNNKPKFEKIINIDREGVIANMDTESIGWSLVQLGCVAQKKGEKLDFTAGIEFYKKTGENVNKNDPIFRVFGARKKQVEYAGKILKSAVKVRNEYQQLPLIL